LLIYYIDEPLSVHEQNMVIEQINTISINKIDRLDFIQLIDKIPSNDTELSHAEIIKAFEDILIKLGIPAGVQSTFILPKGGLSWGMLLQMAFKNVSSFYPFVVQPWEMGPDKKHKRRERILVTDINSAMPA
jgi:hypothetical protein